MKIGTKAMLTILVISMLALSGPTASALGPEGTYAHSERKLERLYKHHDRKMELRASVLGLTADRLREEAKHKTLNQIVREHGFKNRELFHKALEGKIRDELKKRGFSEDRIAKFFEKRQQRFIKHTVL